MDDYIPGGFILLSRKIEDTLVFKNPKWLKVWVWCLLKASHKECHVPIKTGRGTTVVKIERGQFIFGRHEAAKELNMAPSTVWDIMQKLKKFKNTDMQTNTHYTIVSICNYDKYQNLESYYQQPNRQPTDNQPTHTKKYKEL